MYPTHLAALQVPRVCRQKIRTNSSTVTTPDTKTGKGAGFRKVRPSKAQFHAFIHSLTHSLACIRTISAASVERCALTHSVSLRRSLSADFFGFDNEASLAPMAIALLEGMTLYDQGIACKKGRRNVQEDP